MKNKRKQMRVTIPGELAVRFEESKADAENAIMMKMSDSQYATRLIVWALRPASGKTRDT